MQEVAGRAGEGPDQPKKQQGAQRRQRSAWQRQPGRHFIPPALADACVQRGVPLAARCPTLSSR